MKLWLARWVCLEVEDNLRRLPDACARAAGAAADVAIFPESFLNGYTRQVEPGRAREAFAAGSAAHPDTTFVFGSITEGRRNRVTVWRAGREVARYDKVHLFEPNRENEIWEEGRRYVAFELNDRRIGLLNCNDLRFPEQARALCLNAACDTLLAVAWWPWRRDHVWRALLRARAIENAVFVAGCCVAASVHPGEEFSGAGNHVFDPHGEPVRTADDHAYLLDPERARDPVIDPRASHRGIAEVEVFGNDGRGRVAAMGLRC
ncbi:MAG: nitrilase-related carbon-nitrogen hydrolase [Acidobacteriota bacterium]